MRLKVLCMSILSLFLLPFVEAGEVFELKPAMAGETYSVNVPEVLKTVHGKELSSPSKQPKYFWRLADSVAVHWLTLSGKGVLSGLPNFKEDTEWEFEVIVTDGSLKLSPEIRIRFSLLIVVPKLSLTSLRPAQLALKNVLGKVVPKKAAAAPIAPKPARQAKTPPNHDEPKACDTKAEALDPATFVRILEDTGKKKILLYEPGKSRIFSADPASKILFNFSSIPIEVLLNKLFITAKLRRGGETIPIEVSGYSKIGESKENTQAQQAFAFDTTSDVTSRLVNLHDTTRLLVKEAFPACAETWDRDPEAPCQLERPSRSRLPGLLSQHSIPGRVL